MANHNSVETDNEFVLLRDLTYVLVGFDKLTVQRVLAYLTSWNDKRKAADT